MKPAQERQVLAASEAREVLAAVYKTSLAKTAAVSLLIEEHPGANDNSDASSASARESRERTPDESESEGQSASYSQEEEHPESHDDSDASSASARKSREETPNESESEGQPAPDSQEASQEYSDDDWEDDGASVGESKKGSPARHSSEGQLKVDLKEEPVSRDSADPHASIGDAKESDGFSGSEGQLAADVQDAHAKPSVEPELKEVDSAEAEEPVHAPADSKDQPEEQAMHTLAAREEPCEVVDERATVQLASSDKAEDQSDALEGSTEKPREPAADPVKDSCDALAESTDKDEAEAHASEKAQVQADSVAAEESCNALPEVHDKPKEPQPQPPPSRPPASRSRTYHRPRLSRRPPNAVPAQLHLLCLPHPDLAGHSLLKQKHDGSAKAAQLQAAEAKLQDWHTQREAVKKAELERRLALEEEKEVQKQQLKCYLKSQQRCLEEAIGYCRGRGGQKNTQSKSQEPRPGAPKEPPQGSTRELENLSF